VSDTPDREALAAYVDQAAALQGLTLDPAWRPAVIAHLGRILGAAALVEQFPLPEEPAPPGPP